ncbi:MAG: MotA/TolQ/ExbB proton channel family protein [Pirellulaceae bacterium]|nr:MotA/TolQ/ExbB proton channel family protein [Pirellulaceae bacterium]
MNQSKRKQQSESSPYSLPLLPIVLIGSALASGFYGLILAGPLDIAMLRRYCLSHPVAIATVFLFSIGMVGLVCKWFRTQYQWRWLGRTSAALGRLTDEGQTQSPSNRVDWLLASWQSEPRTVSDSWLGSRVWQVLLLQQSRGRRHQLENDLKSLSEQAADQQHESYSLLRIIHWAMPMLGFLGTVLGISLTLGQLDTQKLATQQQEAMAELSSGLYVAFDTTAIALMLTVASMFVQFAVNRSELSLLDRISRELESALVGFLAVDPFDAQDTLLVPVRQMANDLIGCVRELVVEQATVWSRSIAESQQQWAQWTDRAASEVDLQLASSIGQALSRHLATLETLQESGARQVECRLQQWQTTLSEQTRALHSHQKELVQQSATLQQLVEATTDLKKLEEAIGQNLQTLQAVGQFDQTATRIQQATECMTEAVAKLATSLERSGLLRAAPQRPRSARETASLQDDSAILPLRSAGDQTTSDSNKQPRGKAA